MSSNNGQQLATTDRIVDLDPIADLSARTLDTLVGGNLSQLDGNERLAFVHNLCESLRLNPLTKPFEFMTLQGKLTLYATKDCAAQLRKIHGVSITSIEKSIDDGILTVHVKAMDRSGKTDEDFGMLSVAGKSGQKLADEVMKCVTKAKRRVTLSICGLGLLDETEASDARAFIPADMRGVPSEEMVAAADRLKAAVVAKHPQFKDHTAMQLVSEKASKEGIDHPSADLIHEWAAEIEGPGEPIPPDTTVTDDDLTNALGDSQ